jgi:hypothetical protein
MKASRVHVRTGGWQAWLDLVVAAAVVGLPLYRGHSVVLVLPAAGILTVFAVWRWLSDAEVSFDADGVRVSDSYWRLLRREPILFPYAEGIEIVAESGGGFGVAWVNGLRIAAASRAAARLETAARNLQLPFRRVDTSIATASPTILLLAAIPSLFLVHGLLGWLIYYGLYGSGLVAVLIPYIHGHRAWEASAARRAGSEADTCPTE